MAPVEKIGLYAYAKKPVQAECLEMWGLQKCDKWLCCFIFLARVVLGAIVE